MKETIRQQLSEHYARDIEGLNVEGLIAEALASIEAMFSYMNEDDVFKHSRPYAVSYLALCAAQELLFKKPVNNGWISVEENQPDSVGDDVLVVDKSGKYHIAYYLSGSENWMNQDTREPIKNVVKWRYLDGDSE